MAALGGGPHVSRRLPVIVLGASHPSALAVIRALGRAGVPVVAV
jgi:hypothetical protein